MLFRCALVFASTVLISGTISTCVVADDGGENKAKDDSQVPRNKAVELIKYFNPIPQKSYLNQSQDREIKKKNFKNVSGSGAEPVLNQEVGLFAIVDAQALKNESLVGELLANQSVNGISVLLSWQSLEMIAAEVLPALRGER